MRNTTTILIYMLLPSLVIAGDMWNCQTTSTAGMINYYGEWANARFDEMKFKLIYEGKTITVRPEFSGLFGNVGGNMKCNDDGIAHVVCSDVTGSTILFKPKDGRGALSHLYGVLESKDPSPIYTSIFSCVKQGK